MTLSRLLTFLFYTTLFFVCYKSHDYNHQQGRAGRKRRDPHLIACRAPAMKPLVQRDPHLIACRAPAMKPLVQRDPHLIACRAPAMKPLVHVTRYFSGRRLYRNTVDSTGLTTRYVNPVHARRSSRRVHR